MEETKMNSRIAGMWNAKVPVREIAKRLGCTEAYVVKYARTHRELCPERQETIDYGKLVELWNLGFSKVEIAKNNL